MFRTSLCVAGLLIAAPAAAQDADVATLTRLVREQAARIERLEARLAAVEGAAAPAADPAEAAALRQAVTSPGGTTAAALSVLMAGDGLPALMHRAVAAAKRRAGELSG